MSSMDEANSVELLVLHLDFRGEKMSLGWSSSEHSAVATVSVSLSTLWFPLLCRPWEWETFGKLLHCRFLVTFNGICDLFFVRGYGSLI